MTFLSKTYSVYFVPYRWNGNVLTKIRFGLIVDKKDQFGDLDMHITMALEEKVYE